MLNRTNRTPSANLNRLNLGTRSLAASAGVINGEQALRIRHAHRVVMRDGMTGFRPSPVPMIGDPIPAIPGSLSVSSRHVSSRAVRARVELAAETSSLAARTCWRGESQDPTLERDCPRQQPRPERAENGRKPMTGKRLYSRSGPGYAPARAALSTDAAILAASGG